MKKEANNLFEIIHFHYSFKQNLILRESPQMFSQTMSH